MDLRDKLKYYQTDSRPKPPERVPRYEQMAAHLGGEIIEPDTLPVIKIEKFFPFSDIDPSEKGDNPPAVSLPLLTKKHFPEEIPVKNLLIFDLETTGLAGGTGTYPFLVGFGLFEEGGIRLYQYFLPDFGREITAFLDLRNILEDKSILLTYNGKSFDYPLLRNRLIMNRVDNPFDSFLHLDLLHLARRLWQGTLPSCSLGTIEEEIFLFSRYHDIDGALIPQAYFSYIDSGELSEIKRIIDHNQQDLISLSRLLFHLHHIENMNLLENQSHVELYSMLKVALDIADMERINPILNKLKSYYMKIPTPYLKKYSLVLKRKNFLEESLDIWHSFLDRGVEILFATEELAKFYEHKGGSPSKALDFTNRALRYLELMDEISDVKEGLQEVKGRFTHRHSRLNSKMGDH